MIKAVIFDMDGTLVDSLAYWYEAEIEVFGRVGINLTQEMCEQNSGTRIDEVIDFWYKKSPWTNLTKEEVYREIINKVAEMFKDGCPKKPGVDEVLEFVKSKGVKIALASSSPMELIQIVLEKLDIKDVFDQICSGESEKHGKPNPEIYLKTATLINTPPEQCLAVEDSYNGVLAAKAAKMKCVCVPDQSQITDPRFSIADVKLSTLNNFNENVWETLNR